LPNDNDEISTLIEEIQRLVERSAHMAKLDEELRIRLQSIQDCIDKLNSKQE
jgi:hypothetical protein